MFHTFTQGSTSFHQFCRGRGLVNPSTLMIMDNQYLHIWYSVPHANKHLIKFPIALDYTTLRSQIRNSTTPPQTVLLKADTGG